MIINIHSLETYLVGGFEHVLFSHTLGILIPTDFHIFQRVGIPPTRQLGNISITQPGYLTVRHGTWVYLLNMGGFSMATSNQQPNSSFQGSRMSRHVQTCPDSWHSQFWVRFFSVPTMWCPCLLAKLVNITKLYRDI